MELDVMQLKIGNVEIKSIVGLAPMAGISNPSYMKICEEMGIGFATTELISSEAIVRDNKKTFDMLKGIEKLNIPVAVQIFGSNPKTMAKAAEKLCEKIPKLKIIDINMGCPVPKVAIKSHAGSGLLKDIDKVYDIVSSVVKSVSIPVTVKIRSGWDSNSINAKEVAKAIEKAGASAICVHPRTRAQGYSGLSDWNIIKEVKETVSIPVIGNGDIKNCYDAQRMIDETGCDFIMVGRALIGNPWLIKEINYYLDNKIEIEKPTSKEKIDMCLKHLDYLLEFKNEKQAVLEIRSQIGFYLKEINGGKEVKNEIFKTKTIKEVKDLLLKLKEMC